MHDACFADWNDDCSAEVALAVLAAFPGAAKTKGTDMAEGSPRYLPLHYVCDDPLVPGQCCTSSLDGRGSIQASVLSYCRSM